MTCSALRYSGSYQHWHTHGFCALRSQLIAFSIRISELQKQWSLAVRNIVACIVYTSIHFIMTCLYLILILKWHILFVFWHNFRVKYRGYNQVVVKSTLKTFLCTLEKYSTWVFLIDIHILKELKEKRIIKRQVEGFT